MGKEGDGLCLLQPEPCCSGRSYLVGFPACYVGGEFYNCQEQKPTQRVPSPKVNIFFHLLSVTCIPALCLPGAHWEAGAS